MKYILLHVCLMQYFRHTCNKKLFVVYLQFRFHWASCNLSGGPMTALDSFLSSQPGVSTCFLVIAGPFTKGFLRCDFIPSLRQWGGRAGGVIMPILLSQWELRLGVCQKFPVEIRAALAAQWNHLEGFKSHTSEHVFG